MAKKILIGSRAIKHFFSDFPREPKDYDYIVKSKPKFEPSEERIEYHLNPVFNEYNYNIMLPNDLYTLKMSHLFWDIKWDKHIYDVVFLKSKGCALNKELFFNLYYYWSGLHGVNNRSDLEMSAEDFFDNALPKEFNHDYLHAILNPVPVYTKILKDGADVYVDENKFNLLSYEEKLELVREEVMVMAYERYRKFDYRIAFSKMLKKFIINHAPMWEAIFIIENYKELHKPKYNFIEKLNHSLTIKTQS